MKDHGSMFFSFLANAVFIPDENGELIALDASPSLADSSLLSAGDLRLASLKIFLTFVALVTLLFLTYWFLRYLLRQRLERGTGAQSIQVLEKKMVSPKTVLYLIEIEEKKVLFAESHLDVKQLKLESESKEFSTK